MVTTTAEFLGLERIDDRRWRLPVVDRITGGGRGSLFGGSGLAAGILAMEAVGGRPAVWGTGQYLSVTAPGDVIEIDVATPAEGRTVTQCRVAGHVGDTGIITVVGAVGERREVVRGVWASFPDAGRPEDAWQVERHFETDNVHHHVEARMARGMHGFSGVGEPSGDEHVLIWLRMPGVALDTGALALLGDYMPTALGNAVGREMHCTSLDNTIRYGQPIDEDDEWVLCDSRMEFIGNGFAHGTAHLWSRAGRLLATASQSVLVVPPTP